MSAAIAEVPKEKTTPPAKTQTAPLETITPSSVNIPVNMIVRSPFNRKPEVSDEFVANIRQNGVLQPVIVRPVELGLSRLNEIPQSVAAAIGSTIYELVAGERRWLASKKANKPSIPAIIRELTDVEAMKIQIAENAQREDYNILDRADAYAGLRNEYMQQHKGEKGFTEEKCMDLIAQDCQNDKIKGRTVQQIIALKGKLHEFCKAALRQGEMEQSHAYEICRRSEDEQLELLKWLRQQTQHSQGDIPSVRRLKDMIRGLDIRAEEKRRQEKLFKDPQPGTATTHVPTIEEAVYAGALKLVKEIGPELRRISNPLLQRRLNVGFTLAGALLEHMEKEGIVGPADGNGSRLYIPPKAAPAQTLAKGPICIHSRTTCRECKFGDYKSLPPDPLARKPETEAQIKRAQKERDEEQQRFVKQQAEHRRKARIEEQYRAGLFVALASKAHVCSRLLTHVVPGLLLEMWNMDELPVEKLGREILQWPEPRDGGDRYSQQEIEAHAKKHTRKFNGNLLAALCICLHLNQPQAEQLAKYFNIDPKKVRKKAAAVVIM